MQSTFDDQVVNKFNADRQHLLGHNSSSSSDLPINIESITNIKADQSRMIDAQNEGLENLAQIISRQKNIAQTITTEVDFHNGNGFF